MGAVVISSVPRLPRICLSRHNDYETPPVQGCLYEGRRSVHGSMGSYASARLLPRTCSVVAMKWKICRGAPPEHSGTWNLSPTVTT